MKFKKYSFKQLWASFEKMPDCEKVKVLNKAFHHMKQNPNRSKEVCVMLEMGYYEAGDGMWYKQDF